MYVLIVSHKGTLLYMYEKKKVVVPKMQTVDSCVGLIGPRKCSAALGGPAN